MVAPKPETVDAVKAWLQDAGLTPTTISPAGDWLSVSVPVSKANELFDADFSVFKNTASGESAIRTMQYSIPTDLEGHLDFVHPTIAYAAILLDTTIDIDKDASIIRFPVTASFPVVSAPIKVSNSTIEPLAVNCSPNAVTPACIQSLYGIPTTPATQSSNVLGVSGFLQQFANSADLAVSEMVSIYSPILIDMRRASYGNSAQTSAPPRRSPSRLWTEDRTHKVGHKLVSKPWVPSSPLFVCTLLISILIQNLDIQYTIGLATGVPTTFISVGPSNNDGLSGFLDIINNLLAQSNPPQVLTTSYGADETGLPASIGK